MNVCVCMYFPKVFSIHYGEEFSPEHLEKGKTIHVDLISILLCLPSTKISIFLIFEVLKLFTFNFIEYTTQKSVLFFGTFLK